MAAWLANEPVQPSPATPSVAVQAEAPGAFQVRVSSVPTGKLLAEAVRVTYTAALLLTMRVPVLAGSSTFCRVAVPVELVVSEVVFQVAASAVKSAVPLLPFGAEGLAAGQLW